MLKNAKQGIFPLKKFIIGKEKSYTSYLNFVSCKTNVEPKELIRFSCLFCDYKRLGDTSNISKH